MRWIAIVPSLVVCACAASSPAPAPSPTTATVSSSTTASGAVHAVSGASAHVDPYAPMPFTAEEIRAACPVARIVTFRMEMPGKPPMVHVMKFVAADAQGADIESVDRDEKGKDLGPAEKQHATWEELQKHAQFPRAMTKIEDGVADTPAGKFTTRVYIVKDGDKTTTYHFLMDRPGPPVLFYTEQNGERIRSSTLLPNAEPLVIIEKAKPVACKTDDDCWQDDKGKPIARPKEHRGKKLQPCKDSEHLPVCKESVCMIAAYKC